MTPALLETVGCALIAAGYLLYPRRPALGAALTVLSCIVMGNWAWMMEAYRLVALNAFLGAVNLYNLWRAR